MARPFVLTLTTEQYRELVQARHHAAKPYLREHAACILKVAAGHSIRAVAHHGGLRSHRPETVKAWISAYLDHGLHGLVVQSGRGRKPAFFPTAPDERGGTA